VVNVMQNNAQQVKLQHVHQQIKVQNSNKLQQIITKATLNVTHVHMPAMKKQLIAIYLFAKAMAITYVQKQILTD
jgi:hypothetical protein